MAALTVDTKIKPKVPFSDTEEYCKWDYSEKLVIDRETETMEHIQYMGSGCVISRKYYVQDGIVDLLDELDADCIFEHIQGNDPDVITNSNETKNYAITVDFRKRSQLVINGTFDKNSLPDDFSEFAENILNFMQFYGIGEILDPHIYLKSKRQTKEYILCSVEFNEDGKSYYYLSQDDNLKIDDYVLVPVGSEDKTAVVKIVDIELLPEDEIPFPLNKLKSIIGKYTNDEVSPSILDEHTSDIKEFFCPIYDGNISQYDCDEILCGAKHGWIPNDGLHKLIDIEIIKKKRELCLVCERQRKSEEKRTYSDTWIKKGYNSNQQIRVSDIVNYRKWSDEAGTEVGVTVDFETADDFHYELLTEDWNKFLTEVLCITDTSMVTSVFQDFLTTKKHLFAFEDALNSNDIKYKKIAFY